MVFDPANGTPVALMDGTYITATRTAAAARRSPRACWPGRTRRVLARPRDRRPGPARTRRALARVRDFAEVRVAGRDRARADALAAELGGRAVASWQEALDGADVVAATTHTDRAGRSPRVALARASHVNSVGLNPTGRRGGRGDRRGGDCSWSSRAPRRSRRRRPARPSSPACRPNACTPSWASSCAATKPGRSERRSDHPVQVGGRRRAGRGRRGARARGRARETGSGPEIDLEEHE